ncbi:MAG: acetate--CoA ligase [Gammaproteobacteria bacterium]
MNRQGNILPLTPERYHAWYQASLSDPAAFWAEQAHQFIDWDKSWDQVCDWDFKTAHIRWFEGAKLNASYNCLDRHLTDKPNQVALIWESDDGMQTEKITYAELHVAVCKFANGLQAIGVKPADRVCIYLPMIKEAAIAMLACARIGAIHTVVFAGFSPHAISGRLQDAACHWVITADEGIRGGKVIPLKNNIDEALMLAHSVKKVVVVKKTGGKIEWHPARDIWYQDCVAEQPSQCEPISVDAEHPLFILYTSGSTGKPKGVLHTTGGYLLYVAMTHRYVFDYQPGEIFWCTADVGWITGHSYTVYGPLLNGGTTLLFEGTPNYPTPARFWEIIDKHQVNIFYTAPTAIRMLLGQGDHYVKSSFRKSLRLLGTVGEPINPEAWRWYHEIVGEKRCPIVDTWWQTETGGVLIAPLPQVVKAKPGAAGIPFFGVEPVLDQSGMLLLKGSWPGQMRTVYGDHSRFQSTYFSQNPGFYCTGDGAKQDQDGHFWVTGRMDDVLNSAGHRIGTAEVESALVLHPKVSEAAVVGVLHDIKGQALYCYVSLIEGFKPDLTLQRELIELVEKEIGKFARPEVIQFTSGLPKTRSGKIMRRILRKIAEDEFDALGDISTLADPSVVEKLIKDKQGQVSYG